MDDFTPQVVKKSWATYGIMLVELSICPICERYMVVPQPSTWDSPFPIYNALSFETQLKKAGWARRSYIEVDSVKICQDCANSGKADFLCALCGERKETSKVHDSFGDPGEFLCSDCYATVPASVWENKVSQLHDTHRYDFE